MKTFRNLVRLLSGAVLFPVALGLGAPLLRGAAREADWKKVDEAIQRGLPKSAIEALEPIIAGALKDKAYGEAVKAIARKVVLEGNIQGNKPEEKITRLEAEIRKAPKEILQLLETIQAYWYWHYFQNNRWRFLRRTATAQPAGKDFTTWDLPRLFAEIDRHFGLALANADLLKRTPIAAFDELLPKGTAPDLYRPTLYDFIAQEALKFYASGEQAAAKPQDAFEFSADQPAYGVAPLFGPADAFLAGKIERRAEESPAEKAFFLLRDLLRFHRADKEVSAFADVDLARLTWAFNTASGENKTALYQAALKAFSERWVDHEISALARHRWAQLLRQEGNLIEARRLAQQGRNAFRESYGGRLCHNLIVEIEASASTLSTERVWNAPFPKITVRYRNVTNVWLRAVAYDWNAFLERRRNRPEHLSDRERQELLNQAPALAWSAALPATPDFKERLQALPAPETLKPGFYFLIASHDPKFGDADNVVSFTDIWISDLALIVRPRDRFIEGFVLAANSGEPVAGAEILSWHLDQKGERVAGGTARTDENGVFSFPSAEGRPSLLRVRARVGETMQELASWQEYWSQPLGLPEPFSQTMFFTDRAMYRPGQTVQYKGICLRVDQKSDNYEVLAGQEVTVVFSDPNGKEIARASHRCNDYGSFAGRFTASPDRLMGSMQLRVETGPPGAARVQVEEYKRPRFRVTLQPPASAPRLNEQVQLPGRAESYTGSAVDGAQVNYRVVREVRWPAWWQPWRPASSQPAQEIAHGTTETDASGSFVIGFLARPDPAASEQDEPTFRFTVFAEVTDPAGETRSDQRTIQVGFTALRAGIAIEPWQTDDKPVAMKLTTSSFDGEPQASTGRVKVFRLKEPAAVPRRALGEPIIPYVRWGRAPAPAPDPADPEGWEPGELVIEREFAIDGGGKTQLEFALGPGAYRAQAETQDRFGRRVSARHSLLVLKPDAGKFAVKLPHLVAAPAWSVEPGEEFSALWGTGYDEGRALVEIEQRHQIIQRFWTQPGRTQQTFRTNVTEALRGGFTVHVTQVRENRAYLTHRRVEVPWSNRELELKWERFTSKLGPNQQETWTAVVQKRAGVATAAGEAALAAAAAEMVATLYDESLDQFLPNAWPRQFSVFRHDDSVLGGDFANVQRFFQHLHGQWQQRALGIDWRYREFPSDLIANFMGFRFAMQKGVNTLGAAPMAVEELAAVSMAASAGAVMSPDGAMPAPSEGASRGPAATRAKSAGQAEAGPAPAPAPDLARVSARRNLNETAFFFPQLLSDAAGTVKLQFTMPEALTGWRLLAFAHDRQLRSGFLEGHAVTAKELMVQPNPPRFLREGDVLEFTVKVSNQTDSRQQGRVRLNFGDARSQEHLDALLGNATPEAAFDIPGRESRTFSWRIRVPDGAPFLTYKAVGSTGRVSDGEEGYLPVLSRHIFVTESLPLPIRGRPGEAVTKQFDFARLRQSGRSRSLIHQNLTVQMVSNPAWYAVLALPYLMEFPHECTEQTFNRLYANALARFMANSDPRIRRVFEQWKGTPALDSPLEKNQELKSVLIEETPWLRQAQNESQARRNVGLLFDATRLDAETEHTLQQLAQAQLPDGTWPWFPGGRGNDYITLYIVTGFGRLRHLGADVKVDLALRALARLDAWMGERYLEIQRSGDPKAYVPGATDALYLYGRSFFLKDRPVPAAQREALDFFLARARQHWLKVANRQSQGHLAIALRRFGASQGAADPTPADIMKSLKERSVTDEELGRYWRETELSWWWYRAPIETQALMIEAFDEVAADQQAAEEAQVWLLKQKQTQDWKTTKATADAVYALLLRGRNLLASEALVEITLGGVKVSPDGGGGGGGGGGGRAPTEAGTGFYEKRFGRAEIQPKLAAITVTKRDEGVAWGSVHWQYLEDMSKVTAHTGTPLKLTKSLFTKVNTKRGKVLEPVKGAVHPGDELVVRLELRVDRDMEYVHLKDQRGSGTEPVNVLSQYHYQDGLAYYESARDTASHFYIDYLPKGTYVFEYSTRVQHRGRYQTGIAEIQCMYAPEFNSHSGSVDLVVE